MKTATTSTAKSCLLIVDDEPDLRDLIKELCSELTSHILVAADGLKAMDIIRDGGVDAILSDINMPHMSGLQLLTELRSEGFQTPFVILSGYGDKKNTLEALRLGATDFIEKPFDDDQLLFIMESALQVGAAINQTETEIEQLFNQFKGSVSEIEKLKSSRTTLLNLKKSHHLRIKKQKVL